MVAKYVPFDWCTSTPITRIPTPGQGLEINRLLSDEVSNLSSQLARAPQRRDLVPLREANASQAACLFKALGH
jgi:hypothetical protein